MIGNLIERATQSDVERLRGEFTEGRLSEILSQAGLPINVNSIDVGAGNQLRNGVRYSAVPRINLTINDFVDAFRYVLKHRLIEDFVDFARRKARETENDHTKNHKFQSLIQRYFFQVNDWGHKSPYMELKLDYSRESEIDGNSQSLWCLLGSRMARDFSAGESIGVDVYFTPTNIK